MRMFMASIGTFFHSSYEERQSLALEIKAIDQIITGITRIIAAH